MKKRFFVLLIIVSIAIGFTACTNNNEEVQALAKAKQIPSLYPAYIMEGSEKKWGYINEEGKFIIEPKYDSAADFKANGMAVVSENGRDELIDQSGKLILTSQYLYTLNFSERTIVVLGDSRKSYLMDEKGQVLFETDGSINELSFGMAAFSIKVNKEESLWGYINEEGKIVIEPKYEWAQKYSKDKAIVQISKGHYGIIDKEGKLLNEIYNDNITDLSDDIFVYSEADGNYGQKCGYMTVDGKVILDAVYSEAEEYEDGLAIVNVAQSFESGYGVINKKGEFVIPAMYPQITSLKNGIYAVPMAQYDFFNITFMKKALYDKTGKQLTEFKYYDLERLDNGLISATDDKNTYIINDKGIEVSNIPKAEGIGSIKPYGKLYKVEADNELYYLSKAGKTVWASDNTVRFENGIEVKMKTFRPDRCMLIQYPEVMGLSDSKIQEKINGMLKDEFVGNNQASNIYEEMYTETIEINFTVNKNKDLFIIKKSGYYYPIGAAHGQPFREDYHININTGNLYTLKDLFKADSKYKEKLMGIINRMIARAEEEHGQRVYFSDIEEEDWEEYSGFEIQKDSLKIYFDPYAIAAYAAGFPEFHINYDELKDIINAEGEFWLSFEKDSSKESKKMVNETYPSEKTKIEEAMKYYENTMIEAINNNDFKLVEPWLYPESRLYTSQKKLVADLNRKQIKERLDSYSIENIELDDLGTVYRVYVTENIGIQYPGQDYTTKQFNWVYSMRYSYENQQYQLTFIDKWEKK
jgi:hypothetical protein